MFPFVPRHVHIRKALPLIFHASRCCIHTDLHKDTAKPRAVVECGSYDKPSFGCADERNDAAASWIHALLYVKRDVGVMLWANLPPFLQTHADAQSVFAYRWMCVCVCVQESTRSPPHDVLIQVPYHG